MIDNNVDSCQVDMSPAPKRRLHNIGTIIKVRWFRVQGEPIAIKNFTCLPNTILIAPIDSEHKTGVSIFAEIRWLIVK